MTFVMRDTSGQRFLTLQALATSVGRCCSPWSLTLCSVATSGVESAFVALAGSTMVGRPLEERPSDSDSDVPSGSSLSGCVGGGSGKSSSA
eukprot:4611580-Pleurochrysis_carterae.AAC.1